MCNTFLPNDEMCFLYKEFGTIRETEVKCMLFGFYIRLQDLVLSTVTSCPFETWVCWEEPHLHTGVSAWCHLWVRVKHCVVSPLAREQL
jgi:hypothetical protein